MRAEERRLAIAQRLAHSPQPVSASTLAREYSVSRQVIVGDIALLRAGGENISATPRGYTLQRTQQGIFRTIACQHDNEGLGAELYAIVDQGCTVVDVIVEHPIYGQLTGPLQLSSRYDVDQFLYRVKCSDALPLSRLTDGIHLHTLCCPDEAAFARVTETLSQIGALLKSDC